MLISLVSVLFVISLGFLLTSPLLIRLFLLALFCSVLILFCSAILCSLLVLYASICLCCSCFKILATVPFLSILETCLSIEATVPKLAFGSSPVEGTYPALFTTFPLIVKCLLVPPNLKRIGSELTTLVPTFTAALTSPIALAVLISFCALPSPVKYLAPGIAPRTLMAALPNELIEGSLIKLFTASYASFDDVIPVGSIN